jgi:NADPH:quinone reductase-like Zn-dependent oxidoreductase
MSKAVRFEQYGGIEVLQVVEVPEPTPGSGEVLVRVKAAGINPGESKIRAGLLAARWPATFPSGEGTDLAGVVEGIGPDVTGVSVGDEIIGFSHRRSSHAQLVVVNATDVTPKPENVSWETAGSMFVAGTTAYAALRAVALRQGDTVVVSSAAGGVGSIAVQLAVLAGARVIGIAGPANHAWLADHGVTPVGYGEGLVERVADAAGGKVDAFIDTFGGDYVELAIKLGVEPSRVDTVVNLAAVEQFGVKAEGGGLAASAEVLAELARLLADGSLEIPIAATYPLDQVREAYEELEHGHTRGKIVLIP